MVLGEFALATHSDRTTLKLECAECQDHSITPHSLKITWVHTTVVRCWSHDVPLRFQTSPVKLHGKCYREDLCIHSSSRIPVNLIISLMSFLLEDFLITYTFRSYNVNCFPHHCFLSVLTMLLCVGSSLFVYVPCFICQI